jgi:hypothetical protein
MVCVTPRPLYPGNKPPVTFVYHKVILVLPKTVEYFPRMFFYFILQVILRMLWMKNDLRGAKAIEERSGLERDVHNLSLILPLMSSTMCDYLSAWDR